MTVALEQMIGDVNIDENNTHGKKPQLFHY